MGEHQLLEKQREADVGGSFSLSEEDKFDDDTIETTPSQQKKNGRKGPPSPPPVTEISVPLQELARQGLVELGANDWKALYYCSLGDLERQKQVSYFVLEENRVLKRQLIELQKNLFEARRNASGKRARFHLGGGRYADIVEENTSWTVPGSPPPTTSHPDGRAGTSADGCAGRHRTLEPRPVVEHRVSVGTFASSSATEEHQSQSPSSQTTNATAAPAAVVPHSVSHDESCSFQRASPSNQLPTTHDLQQQQEQQGPATAGVATLAAN